MFAISTRIRNGDTKQYETRFYGMRKYSTGARELAWLTADTPKTDKAVKTWKTESGAKKFIEREFANPENMQVIRIAG